MEGRIAAIPEEGWTTQRSGASPLAGIRDDFRTACAPSKRRLD
jgi:hypothetical protein